MPQQTFKLINAVLVKLNRSQLVAFSELENVVLIECDSVVHVDATIIPWERKYTYFD